MRKSRKLVLHRETLHSLELRNVAGAASLAVCGTLQGTTQTTGTSNTYNPTFYDCATEVCSDFCATGGEPCTAPSYCLCH